MNSDILPPLKEVGLAKYVKLYLSLLSCVDIVLFCHYNRDARKNKKRNEGKPIWESYKLELMTN